MNEENEFITDCPTVRWPRRPLSIAGICAALAVTGCMSDGAEDFEGEEGEAYGSVIISCIDTCDAILTEAERAIETVIVSSPRLTRNLADLRLMIAMWPDSSIHVSVNGNGTFSGTVDFRRDNRQGREYDPVAGVVTLTQSGYWMDSYSNYNQYNFSGRRDYR